MEETGQITQLVAVGSENQVKIAAVEEAFRKVWPDKSFRFEGTSISSGVPDQPMSDEESITGAKNRAQRARQELSADFGVGLEGGIQKIGETFFDCGWIVIVDIKGHVGIGSSIKMEVPPKMMRLIKKGIELGHVCDIIFKQENTKHKQGHFGLMTNNAITRKEGYRDGVIAALAAFVNPEIFSSEA